MNIRTLSIVLFFLLAGCSQPSQENQSQDNQKRRAFNRDASREVTPSPGAPISLMGKLAPPSPMATAQSNTHAFSIPTLEEARNALYKAFAGKDNTFDSTLDDEKIRNRIDKMQIDSCKAYPQKAICRIQTPQQTQWLVFQYREREHTWQIGGVATPPQNEH